MEDFSKYNQAWIKRALNPETPTKEAMETIKSANAELDGMHIVFPTIRMMGGKLIQLDNDTALEIAKQKKDYVAFDSADEALNFSKSLSKAIGLARQNNKRLK